MTKSPGSDPARTNKRRLALLCAAGFVLVTPAQAAGPAETTSTNTAAGGANKSAAPPAQGKGGKGRVAAAPPAPVECQSTEAGFFRDEGLRMKVFAKLQLNKQLLRETIDVHVNGGVATLSGGVSTEQNVSLAGKLAGEVSGISCVNNFLHVGPPTPPARNNP